MSALLDLASKCEAAKGPDRELDKAIALATAHESIAGWQQPASFTASLDAAMALVPEGFRKEVRDSDARGVWAYLFSGTEPADYIEEGATTVLNPHYGQGVTWSLALCAAALRARAAEQSALNREGGK